MFDTIIKKECGCASDYLLCNHCHQFNYLNPLRENMAYERGFYEGKKAGFEMAMDEYKIRFKSIDEQDKYVQKLKEAMKPLEELLKEIQ